ncbi:MAG: heme exporter protein B [Polaribacter sp.]|jgi:heme exporter protein B
MTLLKEIAFLLRKEVLIELRQKYAIGGILLYVISTVFIVYMAFVNVNAMAWNTLFWIVMLFASVNAVAKSFVQESGNRQLYYYTLTNPTAIILSKILYNVILLLVISLLAYGAFSLVAGNPVRRTGQFVTALFLGSVGLSIAITFVSAIAAKANNSGTLMAILSFPIVIPILMTLIKISANALGLLTDTSIYKDILILLAIDGILLAMAFVLFPFLWRD